MVVEVGHRSEEAAGEDLVVEVALEGATAAQAMAAEALRHEDGADIGLEDMVEGALDFPHIEPLAQVNPRHTLETLSEQITRSGQDPGHVQPCVRRVVVAFEGTYFEVTTKIHHPARAAMA